MRIVVVYLPLRKTEIVLFIWPKMFPQTSVSTANEQVLPLMVIFVHVANDEIVELGHKPQFNAMML